MVAPQLGQTEVAQVEVEKVDFEKVDRDHLADMIYDYLVDNYGEVTSFDMKITGFYETAKYEFKRRK